MADLAGAVGLTLASGSASLIAASHLAGTATLTLLSLDGTVTATGSVHVRAQLSGTLTLTLSNTGRMPTTHAAELTGALALSIEARVWGDNPTVYLEIGGVPRISGAQAGGVLLSSLTISDVVDGQPNTCAFTAVGLNGFRPLDGQRVLIAYEGRENPSRLFHGTIVQTQQTELPGVAKTPMFHCTCIDDTWRLAGRLVVERYQSKSGTFIAQDLMAKYAPGFTAHQVAEDLPVLDEITITNSELPDALTQLVRRFGGHWDLNEFGDLIVSIVNTTLTAPRAITPTHPSLRDLQITRDLTQEANRIYVEGGGVNALEAVSPGDVFLPVDDAAWYESNGGVVVSGPQRIAYTAARPSLGGTLVGPGAVPLAAPFVAAVPDPASLLGIGLYGYAIVDVTLNGRTLPGPIAYVVTGPVAPPVAAPVTEAATIGGAVTAGSHDYVLTFVVGTTETLPSPVSLPRSAGTLVPPPAQAPVLMAIDFVGAVPGGWHDYAITWVMPSGEETTPSPRLTVQLPNACQVTLQNLVEPPSIPGRVPGDGQFLMRLYRTVVGGSQLKRCATFGHDANAGYGTVLFDNLADADLGANAPTVGTLFASSIPLTLEVSPLPAVSGRRLYRRFNGTGPFKLVVQLTNQSATYTDTLANASLGANAPTVGTAFLGGVSISGVVLGASPTIARDLYRTELNGSQLKFLLRVNDNTSTGSPSPILPPAAIGATSPLPQGGSGPVGPHQWAFTFRRTLDGAETAPSPVSAIINMPQGGLARIQLGGCSTAPAGYTRQWYRTLQGGSTFYRLPATASPAYWSENTGTGFFQDALPDNLLPTGATMVLPTVWTGGYIDEAADVTLGANAPIGDTSGIPQPAGQVLAGSPTLIVAGAAGAFFTTGGWAVIGNGSHPVRYTGLSGNTLIGIPVTGPGSVSATVPYNSQVTAADMLVGIPASGPGSIQWPILQGDAVNLLVRADDTDAQAALSAVLDPLNLAGGAAGIREVYLQDRRLGQIEALAWARTQRELLSSPVIAASYVCRDRLSRAGAVIEIDMPAPTSAVATLKILAVTIAGFGIPHTFPSYTVTAGARYSFEELLRGLEEG